MSKKAHTIVVRYAIQVNATPEQVWDFTQDYEQRPLWDESISKTEILNEGEKKRVRVWGSDGSRMVFEYKLFERPSITTLSMEVEASRFLESGGGSWKYEANETGALWTQINSVSIKPNLLLNLIKPLIAWSLQYAQKKAMHKAKKLMETKRASGFTTPN